MTDHDHGDEPHTHTIAFTDENGDTHTFDHDCPCSMRDIHELFVATGAAEVNGMTADGNELPFESVFDILGQIRLLPMLGRSYQTPENLIKLMVGMGTEVTD